MSTESLIQERLGQIRQQVATDANMVGVTVPDRPMQPTPLRNNDCDLEFCLVVKPGFKSRYIKDLTWLTQIQHIAFKYRHVESGYRFLFSDGMYCEFSITEQGDKAQDAPNSLPWPANLVDSEWDYPAANEPTSAINHNNQDWLLGEMLTNLLIGLRRFIAGDRLSAFYCIQHHALGRLLTLISKWEVNHAQMSKAYGDSSFEQAYPTAASRVASFALGYDHSPQSALAILQYAEQHHALNFFIKDQILNLVKLARR